MSVTGGDIVLRNLDAWEARTQARALVAMEVVMAALENWAKAEHGHPGMVSPVAQQHGKDGRPHNEHHDPPFRDETGATTISIKGVVAEVTPLLIRGVLSAGMDYDVYLELAKDGKWAFLAPTVENHKAEILAMVAGVMKGD